MKKGMLVAILVIMTAFHCTEKDPISSRNGGLALELIFPAVLEKLKSESISVTIDRIHIVIQNNKGKNVIDQDLKKSGDSFVDDFKLAVGSGYSLSLNCYQATTLIYQGTESNIRIRVNAVTTVQVQLVGVFVNINLSLSTLDFSSVTIGNNSQKTLRISNTGTATLQVSGMSTTNAAFTIIGNTSFSISPGGNQDVTIRFTPTSATTYNATLRINNNSAESVKEVTLTGTGTISVITISSNSLDFGSVTVGNTSDKTLRISNTGTATLQVSSMSTINAAFTIIGSTSFNITPGSYQDVTVRFTPTSAIIYNGTLRINNNSAENAKDVALTGTGTISAISLSANTLDFGSVTLGNTSSKTLRVSNTGTAALQVSSISTTSTSFIVTSSTSFTITPGAYQDVTIRFAPASAMTYNETLRINNNSPESIKEVTLTGIGTNSAITLSLSTIDFGSVILGNTSDKILRISNTGTATLQVSSMSTTNAAFTIISSTSFSIIPGAYQDVAVRFTPTSSNTYHATLRINNNSMESVKDVALTGTGTMSAISLSANTLDFGSVTLGNPSEKTLRISNTGTATLQVSSMNTTNTAFTVVGSTSLSIAPGAYRDVIVRFTPTSATTYNAILHINNNSAESVKDVTLTGIGTISVITVSSNSLDFGSVTIGNTSEKTLRISNTGTATLQVSSMSTTNTVFTIVGSTSFNIAAGNYQDVTVRFTPTSATTYNATLHINNNSAESVKDATLTGTGTFSTISVSMSSLDFGSVPISNKSDKSLRISNTGTATLQVSSMSTTNAVFTIIGVTSFSIIPGNYQDVTVRFTPTSATTYTATLHINNNSAESVKDVALSGISTQAGYETGAIIDIDGNTYKTVKIGNQWWMAENLKVTHYLNGDAIPNVTDNISWKNLTTGAFCEYSNNPEFASTYGRLYNWHAVRDNRKISPVGWHIPGDEEWQALIDYLGGDEVAGGKMRENGTEHWGSPNDATNESGFTALPSGYRDLDGYYWSLGVDYVYGNRTTFWSSTESINYGAWTRTLYRSPNGVFKGDQKALLGYSVRCIRTEGFVNTPPSASFNIAPSFGTTQTDFQFDASECTDAEDPVSSLQVHWDWTSDGTWDTNFSTTKTATHQYPKAGTYIVSLEVKDTGGLTNTTTRTVNVENIAHETGTVIDIDGNVYKTVKIGNQWWMAENLKVTHYRNGDEIPYVIGSIPWSSRSTSAYCTYSYREDLGDTYGNLYNWYSVNDGRGLAPAGWHVPSDAEWQTLIDYLGGDAVAGGKMKEIGNEHWATSGINGTNESGFTALAGGFIDDTGTFRDNNGNARFWYSTDFSSNAAWGCTISYQSSYFNRSGEFKRAGLSVRCVCSDGFINTPPNASFYVTPSFGITQTDFLFDASSCTDAEDPVSSLLVRWDWTSDGTWDTDFSTTKTATYLYSTPGSYTITLEVKDTEGLTSSRARQVYVIGTGTVTDIDGNVYKTVKIGNQNWMAENLKVTHYRNGDPMPNVVDIKEWVILTTGAYCNYNNDEANVGTYGRLYNLYAVNDARNIAPAGWHVPSDAEWQSLVDYLGGTSAGGKMKETGTTHWSSPNIGATNESIFSALPGGRRGYSDGWYYSLGSSAYFWPSNDYISGGLWEWELSSHTSNVYRYGSDDNSGFSVRCIKD